MTLVTPNSNFSSKRDTSLLGSWWWAIDKVTFCCILLLIAIGILLSFAASPPVAFHLKLDTFYFVKRHVIMLVPSIFIMIWLSTLSLLQIKKLSLLIYVGGVILLIWTYLYGLEIKGARRWIVIAGNSIQASEFIKPALSTLVAWFLAEKAKDQDFPGITFSIVALAILLGMLLLQPDLGMSLLLVATWIGQLFIAGMPIIWMVILAIFGIFVLCGAYFFLPHVTKRIDQFFDSSSNNHDLYQVQKSLESFVNGGIFGKGPGEGIVKKHVPDAHADFVFAVAGEEFGLIFCMLIVIVFTVIVIRSLARSINNHNFFVLLATGGLSIQFGLQAFVNMASALHLIPTKGMTMPFISYGGSSMLSLAITTGMLLGLTKKRYEFSE